MFDRIYFVRRLLVFVVFPLVLAGLVACQSGAKKSPPVFENLSEDIDEVQLRSLVEYFSSADQRGRMTGSPEERIYSEAIAQFFASIGLRPIAGAESFILPFSFDGGGELVRDKTRLRYGGALAQLDKDWRPLSFSPNGQVEAASIVFAGYCLKVPAGEGFRTYDSFYRRDLKDKWVMCLRYVPEKLSGKQRVYYQRYARLRFKVKSAEERGAKGVIFVSGPTSKVKKPLIAWSGERSAQSGIPAISVSDAFAEKLIGKKLLEIQSKLDRSERVSVRLTTKVGTEIQIRRETKTGLNVVGVLKASDSKEKKGVLVGAHGDHLGVGNQIGSSLAHADDTSSIHYGADDNASGMAGVLELAHYFSQRPIRQDLYFAIWSGEELGTIGSQHFAKNHVVQNPIGSYINMDMIGRMSEKLYVQGVGSSMEWTKIVENQAERLKVKIALQEDPYLPTDTTPFYLAKIPGISLFTGTHQDYHSPRDTADKINYRGILQTVQFASGVLEELDRQGPVKYAEVQRKRPKSHGRRKFRIYVGTIPDYTSKGVVGLKLSGVIKGGPAEKAGLKKDDIIVQLGTKVIKNIYDYMYVLETARAGEKMKVIVIRGKEKKNLELIPDSRQ